MIAEKQWNICLYILAILTIIVVFTEEPEMSEFTENKYYQEYVDAIGRYRANQAGLAQAMRSFSKPMQDSMESELKEQAKRILWLAEHIPMHLREQI